MEVVIASEAEARKLWSHVYVAAALCISSIEGYVQLGIPGADPKAVGTLRDRLDRVLETLKEGNTDASPDSAE